MIYQSVHELCLTKRTDKQTNRQTNILANFFEILASNKPTNEHTCQNCKFWQVTSERMEWWQNSLALLVAECKKIFKNFNVNDNFCQCILCIFYETALWWMAIISTIISLVKFHSQRQVTGSFHVFFDLRLIKWLSKQSLGWRLETPLQPLWRHCNDTYHSRQY